MASLKLDKPLVCAALECETIEEMGASMEKAKSEGANIVELCIDSLPFIHNSQLESLIKLRTLPAIVSFRYEFFIFNFPHRTYISCN